MNKISVSLSGHQTSVSIEREFIDILKQIAKERKTSVASTIKNIDETRSAKSNLSSEIRIWILKQILKTTK